MTDVGEPIQRLIAVIEEGSSNEAIVFAAFLIERQSMSRQQDSSYAYQLTDELYRHQINQHEVDALVTVLLKELPRETKNTGTVIWALGKTYSFSIVAELVSAYRNWKKPDANMLRQLLIAIEDCTYEKGKNEMAGFVSEIVAQQRQLEFQKPID